MDSTVEIDEIDSQILHMLIVDAREGLKEISEKCGISTVAVLNRINRLKELGVITGATVFARLDTFEFKIVASVGMELDAKADVHGILEFFSEHTCIVEPGKSIGKYDLCALIYAEDITSLNDCIMMVRRLEGIRKVVVMVWSGIPFLNFGNVDLLPGRE